MKVNHITINVTDLEKSRKFYSEILGLPELDHVRMEDHDLYYFSLGNGLRLELITYDDDLGTVHNHVKSRGMYRHIALEEENIEELYEKCKKENVKILDELGYVPKLKFTNFLIEDPNGVEIEILKY